MRDILGGLFVLCSLIATGLSGPARRMRERRTQTNDRLVSTATVSNPSTITVLEINDSIHDQENQRESDDSVKIPELFGDRQNKLKDRTLVKIIRKSKTPRYKLRDPITQNDLFSAVGQESNNNSLQFQELYALGQTGRKDFILVNPKLQFPNITISNIPIPLNKQEFVYTYVPVASMANGTEIELTKNTVVRFDSLSNTITNKKNTEKDAKKRSGKHSVRKYFRLHSSIAKELEENSYLTGAPHHVLPGPSGQSVHWTSANGSGNVKVSSLDMEPPSGDLPQPHTLTPRMQTIVLRWNLILV